MRYVDFVSGMSHSQKQASPPRGYVGLQTMLLMTGSTDIAAAVAVDVADAARSAYGSRSLAKAKRRGARAGTSLLIVDRHHRARGRRSKWRSARSTRLKRVQERHKDDVAVSTLGPRFHFHLHPSPFCWSPNSSLGSAERTHQGASTAAGVSTLSAAGRGGLRRC
jgi:hypothetical protein